eukprot:m.53600 g.53600  ORF g.53600 m.53600 type:complete len:278 (-) comp11046_c0_seq2:925-1758(-)
MDVEELLRESKERQQKLLSRVEVQREENFIIDEGNLLGHDVRPIELRLLKSEKTKDQATEIARENTQLLFNALWKLPRETLPEGKFVTLPQPKSHIPREKPVPKEKHKTRWEKFAELKGIQNKKKGRMVFDEATGEWIPRFGYKSANDPSNVPWIEVPANADPYEDQFERVANAKKAKVQKNEEQRMRNIAAARLLAKGRRVNPQSIKKELQANIAIGRSSTASAGVFDKDLPGETKLKRAGKRSNRKAVVGNTSSEKAAQLRIIDKLTKKSSAHKN